MPNVICCSDNVEAVVLGRPVDYSLSGLSSPSSISNPDVLMGVTGACRSLKKYSRHIHVPRIADCNASLGYLDKDVFEVTVEEVTLIKGTRSIDAFQLHKGFSVMMRSGDCPTIVMVHKQSGTVCVGHGSRESLISREEVNEERRTREYSSVVEAMMKRFRNLSAAQIEVHIICGIAAQNFAHPTESGDHYIYNTKMVDFIQSKGWRSALVGDPAEGFLSLPGLIEDQLLMFGILPRNIHKDTSDTSSDPNLWSNKEGDAGRNCVLVMHH